MFTPIQVAATVALDGDQSCVDEICKIYDSKVIITTHSPYIVDAFETYSKENTEFYTSIRNEDGSYNIEKIDNMDIIYKKLHEPFLELEKYSLKDFKW